MVSAFIREKKQEDYANARRVKEDGERNWAMTKMGRFRGGGTPAYNESGDRNRHCVESPVLVIIGEPVSS